MRYFVNSRLQIWRRFQQYFAKFQQNNNFCRPRTPKQSDPNSPKPKKQSFFCRTTIFQNHHNTKRIPVPTITIRSRLISKNYQKHNFYIKSPKVKPIKSKKLYKNLQYTKNFL